MSAGEGRSPLLERGDLEDWAASIHAQGLTIAFTNGCFDLIHAGHLFGLDLAAAAADRVVVALNSDRSVRTLKGPGRPIIGELDRARLIAALQPVSAVTIFGEPTPLECILRLRPDVLVKGSEYREEDIVGAREVISWGGRVLRVPMVEGLSTSEIIRAIRSLP